MVENASFSFKVKITNKYALISYTFEPTFDNYISIVVVLLLVYESFSCMFFENLNYVNCVCVYKTPSVFYIWMVFELSCLPDSKGDSGIPIIFSVQYSELVLIQS